MISPPTPKNEVERLQALWGLHLLDTAPEERFDRLTKQAIERLHVPISTVTLLDHDREWFKSCQGLAVKEQPRTISFCAHAVEVNELMIIEDTLKDSRFADNPQVVNAPHIRFYAGVPLRDWKTKQTVGVFCIKDTKPRKLEAEEMAILFDLARQAEEEIQIKPGQ